MSSQEAFAPDDDYSMLPHVTMHSFAVARPGALDIVTMESPVPEPCTKAEYQSLIEQAATVLHVSPGHVKYLGGVELIDEPWVNPETVTPEGQKRSTLITPDRKIVVPPGVRV